MPITQSRMIALIHAARDYQQALQRAETMVNETVDNIKKGSTHQEELENLQWLIKSTGLLSNPLVSFNTIEMENAHFRKAYPHNLRNAARMAAIREGTWEEKITPQKHPPRNRPQRQGTEASQPPAAPATSTAAHTPPTARPPARRTSGPSSHSEKIDLSAPNVVDCTGDINFDNSIGGLAAAEESDEQILAKVDIEKPLPPGAKASVDAFIEALLKEENPENKMKHKG